MHNFNLSSASTKMADALCFADALGPDCRLTFDDKPADAHVYRLPDLWLPTGEIVAADGFIMERQPFTRQVRPGRYPVMIAIAAFATDERIAFVQVRFSDRPVARWEMALIAGQDVSTLQSGHILGYGVDSGTGCFADPQAVDLINEASDPDMKFFHEVDAEMDKVYRHTRSWVHIETPKGSAALFSSGFGDGVYPSYLGLDGALEPVALLTDVGVSDWLRPE
ncbi:MAG TPA: DUF4241 domain-containing protein [Gemmataceae bacterium]|jgi:hypothetical protein|nr:DUF4241 domain-containing protein [Gemmataceae bacterium]